MDYFAGQDTQQEYCYHCWSTTLSVTHLAMLSAPASYNSTDVISISSINGKINGPFLVTMQLRCRSANARLLGSRDRIPLRACVRLLCLLFVVYASASATS